MSRSSKWSPSFRLPHQKTCMYFCSSTYVLMPCPSSPLPFDNTNNAHVLCVCNAKTSAINIYIYIYTHTHTHTHIHRLLPDNTQHSHACPRRDSNPQSQQASGLRPTPWTARTLGLYMVYLLLNVQKNFYWTQRDGRVSS